MDAKEAVDKYPICGNCNIFMHCEKTDILIEIGKGHFFYADLFKCECGNKVYHRFGNELYSTVSVKSTGNNPVFDSMIDVMVSEGVLVETNRKKPTDDYIHVDF